MLEGVRKEKQLWPSALQGSDRAVAQRYRAYVAAELLRKTWLTCHFCRRGAWYFFSIIIFMHNMLSGWFVVHNLMFFFFFLNPTDKNNISSFLLFTSPHVTARVRARLRERKCVHWCIMGNPAAKWERILATVGFPHTSYNLLSHLAESDHRVLQ